MFREKLKGTMSALVPSVGLAGVQFFGEFVFFSFVSTCYIVD